MDKYEYKNCPPDDLELRSVITSEPSGRHSKPNSKSERSTEIPEREHNPTAPSLSELPANYDHDVQNNPGPASNSDYRSGATRNTAISENGYPKEFSTTDIGDEIDVNVMDFSDESIRRGFIRKVFGILMIQLLVTFGIIAMFNFHSGTKAWVTKAQRYLEGSFILVVILSIITYYGDNIRRKTPQNLILLGSLTLSYAVLIAVTSLNYSVDTLMFVMGITISLCLGLILFSIQTKLEFTFWSSFVVLVVIFGFIATIIFILIYNGVIPNEGNIWVRYGIGCVLSVLLSLLLIFDMKRIVNGNHQFAISPEEYILGALGLYVDIVFFILILIILFNLFDDGNSRCPGNRCVGACCNCDCFELCYQKRHYTTGNLERPARRYIY